eukprot:CAMPEP_0197726576 /NCGR_PEP_ID=MMETSP1434-20131217/16262_1 /TAXON_ID=265543 /ORGANISM="Minutocellus polymorphus, Strain CCMP3303" /LENGTH=369 /DNA_ID=CAMNT_0043312553 /DNA_START=146 /DNA_END=1252 /DNA_ORIENTATION=-
MSGHDHDRIDGAAIADDSGATEPELKRRRLLDAGGPIEDDETARQKMRDAKVAEENYGERTGFDPDDVRGLRYAKVRLVDEMSAMTYFAGKGDLPMMRWLYVNGADARDDGTRMGSYFPMYGAAFGGHLEACKWLYDHGAAKDIKRRTRWLDVSPLFATFDEPNQLDLSSWLILRGALCKDDDSGNLDLGLLRTDLGPYLDYGPDSRHRLLKWANGHNRTREVFLAFLMGTHSAPPEYSLSALRKLLLKRLLSEEATNQILESLSSEQYRKLWDNIVHAKQRTRPVNTLSGSSGVLETIGGFLGILLGREARIIRQLTEMLPELNKELDQQHAEVNRKLDQQHAEFNNKFDQQHADERSSSSEEEDDSD